MTMQPVARRVSVMHVTCSVNRSAGDMQSGAFKLCHVACQQPATEQAACTIACPTCADKIAAHQVECAQGAAATENKRRAPKGMACFLEKTEPPL